MGISWNAALQTKEDKLTKKNAWLINIHLFKLDSSESIWHWMGSNMFATIRKDDNFQFGSMTSRGLVGLVTKCVHLSWLFRNTASFFGFGVWSALKSLPLLCWAPKSFSSKRLLPYLLLRSCLRTGHLIMTNMQKFEGWNKMQPTNPDAVT